jgi:hypothetical protein
VTRCCGNRASRHGPHDRIELRIRLGLRQLAVQRGQVRAVVVQKRLEVALELFVSGIHSASLSRIFANA